MFDSSFPLHPLLKSWFNQSLCIAFSYHISLVSMNDIWKDLSYKMDLILSVMPFNLFCSEREVFKGSKHTYYSWHNNLKLTFPNFPISLPLNFQKIIYSKISFHLTAKWATFRVYILHIQKKIYRIFRTIRCTRP